MTSSTSNSNSFFVKTLALGFIVFCGLYAGIIFLFFPEGGNGQNQYQTNRIKCERYLFRSEAPEVVVVGSSQAARLKDLPPHWFNLALPGETSALGLKVILLRADLPKTILVEANPSTRPLSQKLLQALSSPFQMKLKKEIPLLRDEYQPSLIFLTVLKKILKSGSEDPKISDEFRAKLIEKHVVSTSQIQTQEFQDVFLTDLQKAIGELSQHGVKIIFFEAPTEKVLMDSEKMKELRAFEKVSFPSPPYFWINVPPDHGFKTSDGLHLIPSAAREFSKFLEEQTISLSAH